MTITFKLRTVSLSLLSAMVVTACGGGDGDADMPTITPYKTELFTGKVVADHTNCNYTDAPLATASYGNLSKIIVKNNVQYILNSSENCTGKFDDWSNVLKVQNNKAEEFIPLRVGGLVITGSHHINPQHPSGFYQSNRGENLVLGYAAASSDKGFVLDDELVAEFDKDRDGWKGWFDFSPGLFNYWREDNYYGEVGGPMVAGAPVTPTLVDGQGLDARFYAPHDLEANAAGLLYLIDNKRLRTIDQDFRVKTLDLATLGITGTPKTLDADQAGVVHALAQTGAGAYTWHRLSDGRKVAFKLPNAPTGETVETFTVVGDELLVAVRQAVAGSNASWLYRVNAKGGVARLTSTESLALPGTAANSTPSYVFPRVQHLEQGVDGYLYIVLEQGILRVKGYK